METLGRNISFPIKNADGSSFNSLVIHKATVDSVVMSLDDKITGDVYYKDNHLACTMHEYIEYEGVHYVLVDPPTIVREGLKADNSDLKGMTKYSFEFHHPMYVLSNIPFSDVAVSNDEKNFLSENKTFNWIGKPQDFFNKINKNLEGTEWVVVMGDMFPEEEADKISEVLSFDNVTIADAIKTGYDTWNQPFVVSQIKAGETHYDKGKRFKVEFGLPSNQIIVDNKPFTFRFGQGVGLKNNSRTPRKNKIITRLAGYGSENNIPYGYPQIRWYGDPSAKETPDGHTIYKGIVGGEYVNLIHHPFTRTHLMPSVYTEAVFNKISPYLADGTNNPKYDPDIELKDYYDAVYSEEYPYINEINLASPSYELQAFDDIKPELGEIAIVGAEPYDKEDEGYITEDAFNTDITAKRESAPSEDKPYLLNFMIAVNNYGGDSFDNNDDEYRIRYRVTKDFSTDMCHATYSSPAFSLSYIIYQGEGTPTVDWDDSVTDEGGYKQSYFKITLPVLDFDLYACASITEEMQISMRSGACIGCMFNVQVDWDDYKTNFYDKDGSFKPNGTQRDLTRYPKSNEESITLLVMKDNTTFGKLMPNVYQQPKNGDQFTIIGISLPLSYITDAEERLDVEMKSYMLKNNVYYYDYPLKFDENFLLHNTNILEQIKPNTTIQFKFGNIEEPLQLYVKQLTIKYHEDVLPQYDITLTDNIEVVLNQIGQVAEDVEKLGSLVSVLRQNYNRNVWSELDKKLSKVQDDKTPYKLGMGEAEVDRNLTVGGFATIGGSATIKGNATMQRSASVTEDLTIGSYREHTAQQTGQGAKVFSDGTVHGFGAVSKFRTVVFGDYVQGMIAGAQSGARIEESGDARFKSVSISEFLEVPEIRFNRATVSVGIGLRSTGGGIIEDVIQDSATTGRCALKLEDGEYGAIDLDDLCLGFWHNEPLPGQASGNASADFDPKNGDYELKGFQSIYFRIDGFYATEEDYLADTNVITDTTTSRGANKYFHYAIRGNAYGNVPSTAVRKTWNNHPKAQLHFGQIGNSTNTDRQNLLVTTPKYDLRLEGLTTWNYNSSNIIKIEGDLDGFTMQSRRWDGSQWVIYDKSFAGNGVVLGNAYIYGQIDQFERAAFRCYVDQSYNGAIAPRETETETVTILNGYGEDVTSQFTKFSVTRDSGDSASDAVWNASHQNVGNPFQIAFSDLGIDGITRLSTLFYVTATDEVNDITSNVATMSFSS